MIYDIIILFMIYIYDIIILYDMYICDIINVDVFDVL